jgi:hypothetical protein
LKELGVDPESLKNAADDEAGLLKELDSDEDDGDVDELSGVEDSEDTSYKKQAAKPVQRMSTIAEMKQRESTVVNNISKQDPDELMKKRLSDYINAIEYLKKHNITKDDSVIKGLMEKAREVKDMQKRGDVEIYDIPGEVTPEDILGLSREERIKRFQVYTLKANKTAGQLKDIGQKNFKIFNTTKNPTAKENYDRSIALFKKQMALKKDLLELAKNRWQPIPEFQLITEVFTDVTKTGEVDAAVSKVNVKLQIPEEFQNVGKYYYKFKWMDDEDPIKKMKVNNKGDEVEKSHPIDFGHHKRFASLKVVIKIKLWRCGFFDKTVNTFETNLSMLKKGGVIKKNFKFGDHKFYATVSLDMPLEGDNNDDGELQVLEIVYTAPPFKSATGGPVKPQAANAPAKGNKQKGSVKKTAKGESDEEEEKKPIGKAAVPAGIGPDEIKDPDVQRNLWSLYYCNKMEEKYK